MPYRINNKNQVVFYRHDGSGNSTPVLWLPEDDSSIGLSAGFYNLTEHDGSDDNGIALDINESTAIAGARGEDVGEEEAIVWTISGGTVTGTLIDFSSSAFDEEEPSLAHGLNNASPPTVVGFAYLLSHACGLEKPFGVTFGSTPQLLSLITDHEHGRALSVTTDSTPLAVGTVHYDCNIEPNHDSGVVSIEWEGTAVDEEIPRVTSNMGSQPLKINEAGNIAGWAREFYASSPGSLVVAAYWEDGASAAVELGNFDAHDSIEQTMAYGMNETSPLIVVGQSITANRARAWFQDEFGDWDDEDTDLVINLNDVLLADCSSAWLLREAFDVSDDGWIVGWGLVNGIARGFVLEPDGLTCSADLASFTTGNIHCPDGSVDVLDLFLLLANWNTDGVGADLASPLDDVDVFDLFVLLGAWGPCSNPLGFIPEDEQDCMDEYGFGEENRDKLEACLEAVWLMNNQ